jgi:hypothetical protein
MPAVSPDFVKDATVLDLAEFATLGRHFFPREDAERLKENTFPLRRLCLSRVKSFCSFIANVTGPF